MRRPFWGMLLAVLCAVGMRGQVLKEKPAAPLEKTQWKLVWLGRTRIETATPLQMPYIQLDPESHRVSGSGGCNRLMGSYELDGAGLRFTQMAMTRMACLHGSGTESGFVQVLDEVRSWKVLGKKLLLMDGEQHVVARLAAVAPEG